MPAVKRKSAPLPSRRDRAKATHWRIVKAAYESFCERGYAGTTMAHVASRAGVAVQTVYFVFHTKVALLSRSYDFAVMGEGEPRVPEQQPWYQAMAAEPDARIALRHLIRGTSEIVKRVTPVYLVARASTDADPDIARIQTFHETWRAEGYRKMLELLLAKAPLRTGLSPERANHLLLFYAGPDAYHVFVDVYGWTHTEWIDWAVAMIAEQVFGLGDPESAARHDPTTESHESELPEDSAAPRG
jgi:AcrR family transcriptional regulator